MSYYIKARRGKKTINMPIEEKHIYITDTLKSSNNNKEIDGYTGLINDDYIENDLVITKKSYEGLFADSAISGTASLSTTGIVEGLNCVANYIRLFYRPQLLNIEQGTGARQRIGDKIFLKTVQIMLDLALKFDVPQLLLGDGSHTTTTFKTYKTTEIEGEQDGHDLDLEVRGTETTNDFDVYRNFRHNIKQFYKFRIMVVRFNDLKDTQQTNETELKKYIADWFNTIFVPSSLTPATVNSYKDICTVSNQSKMLRESTTYNGKYQIIYDSMIELNQNDTNKHIELTFNPKINLTFKDENFPTNTDFKNVYGFIIPPTYYKMDMDLVSYWSTQYGNTETIKLANFTTNIKFTYYDI